MSEFKRMSVAYSNLRKGDVVITPERATVWVDRPVAAEEPVPPLPTAPYTVIRVTWSRPTTEGQIFTLIEDEWSNAVEGMFLSEEELGAVITRFEVLAEPTPLVALYQEQERVTRDVTERVRRETAKAVIDRVKVTWDDGDFTDVALYGIAREFGVTDG